MSKNQFNKFFKFAIKDVKRLFRLGSLFILIFTSSVAVAGTSGKLKNDAIADIHNKNFVYNIKKSLSAINIDGVIDEADWEAAQKATDFYLVLYGNYFP